VHQNTLLYQQGIARPGPTLAEHLKIHALARLLLAGSIRNIQVSWVKLERTVAQLCLRAGSNDYGGTLMEENISRLAGATSGQYLGPEEFHQRIRELGRIPAERNTAYTKLKLRRLAGVSDPEHREGKREPAAEIPSKARDLPETEPTHPDAHVGSAAAIRP